MQTMSNKKELDKFLSERMKMQNKNSELLPCPFCGSNDIYCFDAGNKTNVWFVQCNDCCATFPHFDSKQEAIDAWNKRSRISLPNEMYRYMFDYDNKAVPVKCKVGKILEDGFTLIHIDKREWKWKYSDIGKHVFYTKEECERYIEESGLNKEEFANE